MSNFGANNKPTGAVGNESSDGSHKTPQQFTAQRKLQQTKAQVDEVVDIMGTNVSNILERDEKLAVLAERADALEEGASRFELQIGKLKTRYCLRNMKMMIIMGGIGLVLILILAIMLM